MTQKQFGYFDDDRREYVITNPETPYPVIDLMPEQKSIDKKGGTMRLGAYKCTLVEGTKAYDIYGEKEIYERHRHRYEVNSEFRPLLEEKGLIVSGVYKAKNLVEITPPKLTKVFLRVF